MPFLSNAIIDVFHVAGLDLGHHGWRDIASLAKLRLRHGRRLPHTDGRARSDADLFRRRMQGRCWAGAG